MFEVIEIIDTAWGYDEVSVGKFDTEAQAWDFFDEIPEDEVENFYIMDPWGDIVD